MQISHKLIKGVLVFLLVFFTIGCGVPIPVEPIANAYMYWKDGEGHQYMEFSVPTLERASVRSLNRLKLGNVITEPLEYGVKLTAGNQQQFTVKIVEVPGTAASRVSLRINFLGNKDLTELFFEILNQEVYTIRFDNNGKPIH